METTELPQVKPSENIFNPVYTLWFYCPHENCWQCQDQVFVRDEGIFEVYRCTNCGNENKKVVR